MAVCVGDLKSMNFPESQKTGRLAESDVERLFISWGWTVGKDLIDVGYDLFVEPDQQRYSGTRFLVQVKGTVSKKKQKYIARVSKSRLRQYATNPLPVFIVRVTPDGEFCWLHAQPWCELNRSIVAGSGYAGISVTRDRDLNNRNRFESYLAEIFRPVEQMAGAIEGMARKRADYLSSIDPRLSVKVDLINGAEQHEIKALASSPPFTAKMTFKSAETLDDSSLAQLRDHIEYGSPVDIQVTDFTLAGSALFPELGLEHIKGKLSLHQNNALKARFVLTPGRSYKPFEKHLYIDALGYRGQSGLLFKAEPFEQILMVECKISQIEDGAHCHWSLQLNSEHIEGKQYGQLHQLSDLGNWALSVLEKNALHMSIEVSGTKSPVTMEKDGLEGMVDLLDWLVLQGKVQALANFSKSDLTYDSGVKISVEDTQAVSVAYAALRGERVPVSVKSISGKLIAGSFVPSGENILVETEMSISFGASTLVTLPIKIVLENFKLSIDELDQSIEILPSEDSRAFLSHRIDGESGAMKAGGVEA